MPNWCANKLSVWGNAEQIKSICNALFTQGEVDLSFQLDFEKIVSPHSHNRFSEDTEEWNRRHWGCKWNADTVSLEITSESIICFFDTPGSPPQYWFSSLYEHFPSLELRLDYFEPGMQFAGTIYSIDGQSYNEEVSHNEIAEFAEQIFEFESEI